MDIKQAMEKISNRKDGVDHIRVSPFAETPIGKLSSLRWRRKFFIPQLGMFLSPDSFVRWAFSGDDSQRMSTEGRLSDMTKADRVLAKNAALFAKLHQLMALKKDIVSQCKKEQLDLPWSEYNLHASGIKEYPMSQTTAQILKAMVTWLISTEDQEIPESFLEFNYKETEELILAKIKQTFELE